MFTAFLARALCTRTCTNASPITVRLVQPSRTQTQCLHVRGYIYLLPVTFMLVSCCVTYRITRHSLLAAKMQYSAPPMCIINMP